MSRIVIVQTCLVLLLATMAISAAAFFVISLAFAGAADLARWAFTASPHASAAHATHLASLLKASALCGLIPAPIGFALFLADLRRQKWI